MSDIERIQRILDDHEKRISKLESNTKNPSTLTKSASKQHKSIRDLFIELKNDKFFNQPRKVNEIVEKLASMSYHYSGDSLTAPLQRAVRNRVLGRVKKEGKWAWVSR